VHIYILTHTYMYIYNFKQIPCMSVVIKFICAHAYTLTLKHLHSRTHTHIHTHTYPHTHIYIYVCVCVCVCIYIYIEHHCLVSIPYNIKCCNKLCSAVRYKVRFTMIKWLWCTGMSKIESFSRKYLGSFCYIKS